jgi:hypothetical protein
VGWLCLQCHHFPARTPSLGLPCTLIARFEPIFSCKPANLRSS